MPPGAAPHRTPLLLRAFPGGAVFEVEERLYLRVDARGRWTAFAAQGRLFRRRLDGEVLCREGRGGFARLDPAARPALEERVAGAAEEIRRRLRRAPPTAVTLLGDVPAIFERLARAPGGEEPGGKGAGRAAAAEPFPVPILPPHRTRDVVVHPATGCPNHRCSFCAFYRGRKFRLLGSAAFREHLRSVRDRFGGDLEERGGIFLGSASALSIPDALLLPRLEEVEAILGRPRRGVASFLDPDRGPPRDAGAWHALRERGVFDVTLGLETGHPALRRRWGKSDDLARISSVVRHLRAAGLTVALTVLVGLDDPGDEADHRRATIEWLERTPLGRSDRVYLSPLDGSRHATPERDARALWRDAFRQVTPARVAAYGIDRFQRLA